MSTYCFFCNLVSRGLFRTSVVGHACQAALACAWRPDPHYLASAGALFPVARAIRSTAPEAPCRRRRREWCYRVAVQVERPRLARRLSHRGGLAALDYFGIFSGGDDLHRPSAGLASKPHTWPPHGLQYTTRFRRWHATVSSICVHDGDPDYPVAAVRNHDLFIVDQRIRNISSKNVTLSGWAR